MLAAWILWYRCKELGIEVNSYVIFQAFKDQLELEEYRGDTDVTNEVIQLPLNEIQDIVDEATRVSYGIGIAENYMINDAIAAIKLMRNI